MRGRKGADQPDLSAPFILILRTLMGANHGLGVFRRQALNQINTSKKRARSAHLPRFSSVFQRLIKKNQNLSD